MKTMPETIIARRFYSHIQKDVVQEWSNTGFEYEGEAQYTRSDLLPEWKPIGELNDEEFIAMAFKTIGGHWVTTDSYWMATHFMCLQSPSD